MLEDQVLVTKQDLEQFQEKLDLLSTHLDMVLMITKLPAVIKVAEISQIERAFPLPSCGERNGISSPGLGCQDSLMGRTAGRWRSTWSGRQFPRVKRKEMWKALPGQGTAADCHG